MVAAAIFGYYLDDVRRSETSKSARYYALCSGIIILVLVVGAFFIVGSPQSARLSQLDDQKVSDLQGIQWQIVSYWQKKGEMPQNLADLADAISGYVAPNDPQSNKPYEYNVKDSKSLTFELCAEFNLTSSQSQNMPKYAYPAGEISQNWEYEAGRVCFERTIDKQLYPRLDKNGVKFLAPF